MDAMFSPPSDSSSPIADAEEHERSAVAAAGEGIFRNTVAALLTMREMRRVSSTHSALSLPPLNLSDSDLALRSIHIPSPIPIPY